MGALTLKPLSFKVRSWELSYTNYPNFFDNNFGMVTIQKRGNEIIRILPSRHDGYFWITNQTRFYFNKLNLQRLVSPFIKNKDVFIKVQLKRVVQLIQYLKTIQIINNKFLSLRKLFTMGLINYYDNTYSNFDFLANFFKKKLFTLNNTFLSTPDLKPFIRNIAHNYLTIFPKNKINIFNQINIVQEFPRIWSNLKNDNLNYYIGSKKNINIAILQISNYSNLLSNKVIALLLKDQIQIYTEEKLNINFKQIILKTNAIIERYSSLWFDNKKNYGALSDDNVYYHFNHNICNNNNGIHFTFQSYGNMLPAKYNIFLPTSTLLEEKKILLDGYGNLQNLNLLVTRKAMSRSLLQFMWVFYLLFNISKRWNFRSSKKIKKFHVKNFKLLENIILLFYGRLEWNFKSTVDLSNILFLKEKNIVNKSINGVTILTKLKKNY